MQAELGRVVIDDGPQILAAGGVEGLDRLQHFDRQALDVANALEVPFVRLLGGGDALLGDGDLPLAGLDLRMGFDDFAGDEVHRLDFPHPGLLDLGAGVVAGRSLAKAQIASFPPGDAVEIESVAAVGDLAARSRAETAVADAQQNARQPGGVLLAAAAG